MTVAELIAELQKLPSDAVVLQAQDSEGNAFSLVGDISTGRWEETGEFLLDQITPELRDAGYTDEDVGTGPIAICFWPEEDA